MKNKLLIISTLCLSLGFCSCNNPSSSEISSSSSEEISSVDTRTPKEKVLGVCDIIIENYKDKTLIGATQTMNGKVSLTNVNSTTYIYQSTVLELSNVKYVTQSDISNDESKSIHKVDGNYKITHNEEYLGNEETNIELNNYQNDGVLNEQFMFINDDFYCDLSSSLSEYFSSEALEVSPDLKFKQTDLSSLMNEVINEIYPESVFCSEYSGRDKSGPGASF